MTVSDALRAVFTDPDAMVTTYEGYLGRPVEHLDWYEAWGGFRAACINVPLFGSGENPLTADLLARIA